LPPTQDTHRNLRLSMYCTAPCRWRWRWAECWRWRGCRWSTLQSLPLYHTWHHLHCVCGCWRGGCKG
jgi:hypothetical protein